jgi:hypothetical protein
MKPMGNFTRKAALETRRWSSDRALPGYMSLLISNDDLTANINLKVRSIRPIGETWKEDEDEEPHATRSDAAELAA